MRTCPYWVQVILQGSWFQVFKDTQFPGSYGCRLVPVGVGKIRLVYLFTFSVTFPNWVICLTACSINASGHSKIWEAPRKGLPYISSKGLNSSITLGDALIWVRAIGYNLSQVSWVSWHRLARFFLSIWFHSSPFPENCALHEKWKTQLTWRACVTPFTTAAVKAGPLSFWKVLRSPDLGILSLSSAFTTSLLLPVLHGNTSTHPVKVSINTNKYLDPPGAQGITIKACQSSPGNVPGPGLPDLKVGLEV